MSDGSALARAQTAALAYLNPRPRLKVLIMNLIFCPCIIIGVMTAPGRFMLVVNTLGSRSVAY